MLSWLPLKLFVHGLSYIEANLIITYISTLFWTYSVEGQECQDTRSSGTELIPELQLQPHSTKVQPRNMRVSQAGVRTDWRTMVSCQVSAAATPRSIQTLALPVFFSPKGGRFNGLNRKQGGLCSRSILVRAPLYLYVVFGGGFQADMRFHKITTKLNTGGKIAWLALCSPRGRSTECAIWLLSAARGYSKETCHFHSITCCVWWAFSASCENEDL